MVTHSGDSGKKKAGARAKALAEAMALFSFSEPEPASLADIRFLTEYQPLRGGRNPDFDYDSGRLLRLKAGGFGTALHYMRLVMVAEDIGLVAKELCKELPDVSNARRSLYRHTEVQKLSGGGARSLQIHLDSIRVSHRHLIQGRDVLLLDDIATTGFSLCACRLLLLKAGAASVRMFALAKTVHHSPA